jgi:hypothetical protein
LLLGFEVLQDAGLADQLLLLGHDQVHVEAALLHQAAGEDVLGLGDGEAEGGLEEVFPLLRGELHLHPLFAAHGVGGAGEQPVQIAQPRQGVVYHGHVFLQLVGELEHGGEQDHRSVGGVEGVGQVAQLADDGAGVGIAGREEDVEVLEHVDRGLGVSANRLQHRDGIAIPGFGGAGSDLLGGTAQAAGLGPGVEVLVLAHHDLLEGGQHPTLLPGDQVEQGVAGADEDVNLAHLLIH